MTDHPIEAFDAFALGALAPDEARTVLAHADACATCAPLLADSMRAAAALAAADAAPTRRARSARRLAGVAVAAALAIGSWDLASISDAARVPVDALVRSHFTHHPLAGPAGHAKIIAAVDGSWVYLVADDLRPLRGYELVVNGSTLGSVRADLAGRATAYWTRPPAALRSISLIGSGGTLRWDERAPASHE